MLSFFRVNAAYQLFILLIILFLVRIPVLLGTTPLLIPEMQWTLLGEQLSKGFVLYDEIWDSTAPLSAMTYAGLHWLFGRSEIVYHFFAYGVAGFQVIYFNLIMSRQSIFPERNYVPGFVYLVMMNISFDYTTLSPALMATTFLLLALGTLLKQLDREGIKDELLEVGFYIGIATLYYPPSMVFIIWVELSLLLYSGASFRQHIINVLGFFFPIVIVNLYFYLDGHYDAFTRNFLSIIFQIRQYDLNDFQTLLAVIALPVIFAILGFLKILNYGRYTNFQSRVQQVLALYLGGCLLSVGLMAYLAPMQFVIFTPGLAYFAVYFFETYTRKKWIPEVMFVVFAGGVGLLFYLTLMPAFSNSIVKLENLTVKPVQLPAEIRNKKILVLGEGVGEYLNNYPATAYLNWNLSRFDLENLNNYNNVINILRNFEKDPPEYLIDRKNLAPTLFKRIPALARQYQEIDKGIYRKV